MNQALMTWNFKVSEFGGSCTKRCILRDAGLLHAENDWHKNRARVICVTRAAVPVSPDVLSQKHCSTLPVSCRHCSWLWVFLGAITWFGFGEVLSKRYCLCRNRGEGTGYALKCGNAAAFRNKFLCFRGCGREHLWSEQCCSSSRRLHSVSWLPPTAPGISTGCSLGPGIWVRTSNVLLLIQKPLIAQEHSFLWWLPRPGLCPEIVVCGSAGGLGHRFSTVGEHWPLGHPRADGRQEDSQHPMGQ